MSDNLMDSVTPRLAAPVMRQAGGTVAGSSAGADLSMLQNPAIPGLPFADDGDS